MRNLKKKVGVGAGAMVVAGAANAAAVDVAALVTDIGAQSTSVASVGGAVLMILFGIVVYKWIRRTF